MKIKKGDTVEVISGNDRVLTLIEAKIIFYVKISSVHVQGVIININGYIVVTHARCDITTAPSLLYNWPLN